MHDLKKIDQDIFDLGRIGLLRNIEPENLKKEKKKFLAKKKYNPRFTYRATNAEHYLGTLDKLEQLDIPKSPLGTLLENRRKELIQTIKATLAIGTEDFIRHISRVYPAPPKDMIRRAERIHADHDKHREFLVKNELTHKESLDSGQFAQAFQDRLDHYGIDMKVMIKKDMTVRVKVRKGGKVLVKKAAKFNVKRIDDILAHEVDVHILRMENAHYQPYRIFDRGTAGYITTEEGLATLAKKAVSKFKHLCSSSIYLLTIDLAAKNSFRDTYNGLRDMGVNEQRAFTFTLRAKRGLQDTSQPGVFAKDAVYFIGLFKVADFIQNGGDVRDLFVGKIGVDDVAAVKKIEGIKPPAHIPDFATGFPAKVKQIIRTNMDRS